MIQFNAPPPPPAKRLSFNLATLVRVLVLAAFLVTAMPVPAFAADWKINVANYSGETINYLYCRRSDHTDWGNDILGTNRVLKHGESITINFGQNPAEYYDLRVLWSKSPTTDEVKDWWWGGIQITRVEIVRIGGDKTINKIYRK